MEHRRTMGTSWDGLDVWRAREDHTLVAQGSKIRLERRGNNPSAWEQQGTPRANNAEGNREPL